MSEKTPTLAGEAAAAVREMLGDLPKDLVGWGLGDWVKEKRRRNAERLKAETERILRERNVTPDQATASAKLVVILFTEAMDEDRDSLQNLWARLIAAALDPARVDRVRQSFIEIIKGMDPLDALVLMALKEMGRPNVQLNQAQEIARKLSYSPQEVIVSFVNLERLGVVRPAFGGNIEANTAVITPLGAEFVRALE